MTLTERTNAVLAKLREIAECKGVRKGPWVALKDEGTGGFWLVDNIAFLLSKPNASFIARSRTITPAMANALIVAIEGLADIMKYSNQSPTYIDGICPYGCDTPSIAENKLESMLKTLEDSL